MTCFETEAIVLRTMDYRENDRLVTLLAPGHGRLAAVARAARKSRRRFGGMLEQFAVLAVRLSTRKEGQTLYALDSCEPVATSSTLATDLDRFAAAGLACELCLRLCPEGQADPASYDLLRATLDALGNRAAADARASGAHAALRLLRIHGFLPDLSVCAGCGKAAYGEAEFTLDDACEGALCASCRRAGESDLRVAGTALMALETAARSTPGTGALRAEHVPAAFSVVSRVAAHGLGLKLKSLELVAV